MVTPQQRARIVEFVRANRVSDDKVFHAFAKRIGVDSHDAEPVVYQMAHDLAQKRSGLGQTSTVNRVLGVGIGLGVLGIAVSTGAAILRHRPRHQLGAAHYRKPDVPGDYYPRCSNYVAAALGVCVPQKLTHTWDFFGAVRSQGWDFEVMDPKAKWGTMRQFVKNHPNGTWAIETKTHITLVREGVVYDYENRGADGRRVKMAFRLWKQ